MTECILQPGDSPDATLVSLVPTWKIISSFFWLLSEVSLTLESHLIYILTKYVLTSNTFSTGSAQMKSLQFLSQDSWIIKNFHYAFKSLQSFILRLLSESHVSFSFSTSWKSFIFPLASQSWPFFFFLSENSFSFLHCHLAFSIHFLMEQVSVSIPLALASCPSLPMVLCYPLHLCLFFIFCPMSVWKYEGVCASGILPTNTQTHTYILCWSLPTF